MEWWRMKIIPPASNVTKIVLYIKSRKNVSKLMQLLMPKGRDFYFLALVLYGEILESFFFLIELNSIGSTFQN